MSKDPRKRDKEKTQKAEKDRKRAIEYARARKGVLGQQSAGTEAEKCAAAVARPLHECRRMKGLFDQGIGQVIVSRLLPGGDLGVGVFLVDTYCLGIKDAFFAVMTGHDYRRRYLGDTPGGAMIKIEPSYARKLLEDAHAYAANLGLSQSPKYNDLMLLFGDIDSAECEEEFEFGKNGKPFFVNGPYDSPQFCDRVANQLRERLGPDGFERLIIM